MNLLTLFIISPLPDHFQISWYHYTHAQAHCVKVPGSRYYWRTIYWFPNVTWTIWKTNSGTEPYFEHWFCQLSTPRAAVLKGLIDQIDGVFRLDVTHLEDKIWDWPCLQNPKIDGYPNRLSAHTDLAALWAFSNTNEPQQFIFSKEILNMFYSFVLHQNLFWFLILVLLASQH